MAFTYGDKSLTKDNVMKKLDSYQLFKAYCPRFKEIGVKFQSEFRTDPKPSCHIIMWKGDLMYKDFGESDGYRVFDYIARKFNTDYNGALARVNEDFRLGLGGGNISSSSPSLEIPEKASPDLYERANKKTTIEITPRPWTKADAKYWSKYGIPSRLLNYHNIKSISNYKIDSKRKDNAFYAVNPYSLAYSFDYYVHNGVFRRKLYFPQVKGDGKFISNVDDTIVQGWTLLPKGGNILFITKSYKDILIFNLLGYWAIAPNSELTYIPEPVMNKIKQRFDNIYCWFDNDAAGIMGATQFSSKFSLRMNHNPLGEPKDPSDFVEKYSLRDFDALVSKFLEDDSNR
jgi:hypothetical protein